MEESEDEENVRSMGQQRITWAISQKALRPDGAPRKKLLCFKRCTALLIYFLMIAVIMSKKTLMKKALGLYVVLTENPTTFRQWMLSGPEMQREFQCEYLHLEQTQSTQDSWTRSLYTKTGQQPNWNNLYLDDCLKLAVATVQVSMSQMPCI